MERREFRKARAQRFHLSNNHVTSARAGPPQPSPAGITPNNSGPDSDTAPLRPGVWR